MKMHNEINNYRKEFVYEQYTRIVEGFKHYEKVSKVKMLDEIYEVYANPDNIINICTTRELKFLKMVLDNKILQKDYANLKDKYDWEIDILKDKFLLYEDLTIPEEIIDKVKKALKKVNWKEKKKIDELNEILVSYCKIQGTALLDVVCDIASEITDLDEEIVWEHMLHNKLFYYYVFLGADDIDDQGEIIPMAIFQDYYGIKDEIKEQRQKQGLTGEYEIDLRILKTLFYNDFDINNPKIKKFLEELKSLPFFWYDAIDMVKEYALLNKDRKPLKKAIAEVPSLHYVDLTHFFKTLDEAMDEMPSGVLNGFTPNEAKEILGKKEKIKAKKAKNYIKQQNACLSKKDADLFYKIYFGLLDFTNKKYKINKHLKIYNQKKLNPLELSDVIEKYWENKDKITKDFCSTNPYNFNEEELDITREIAKGIRDVFILAKYEQEYTPFMTTDKIYMVKGLRDNIDNIISYDKLPVAFLASVIPFKGNLVYDGIFIEFGIELGDEISEVIEIAYNSLMKYYHL